MSILCCLQAEETAGAAEAAQPEDEAAAKESSDEDVGSISSGDEDGDEALDAGRQDANEGKSLQRLFYGEVPPLRLGSVAPRVESCKHGLGISACQ